jgi:uncharacterized membrane protein
MNPYEFPLALLAFLSFVAVVPVWVWFVQSYPTISEMSMPVRFLVQLSLPATVGLYLVSWLQPG